VTLPLAEAKGPKWRGVAARRLSMQVLRAAMATVLLLCVAAAFASAFGPKWQDWIGGVGVHRAPRRAPAVVRLHERIEYPGCEGFGTALCNVGDAGCQRQLFGLMRCLYGAGPSEPPRIVFVSAEVFRNDVRLHSAKLHERRQPLEWAGVRLGLHPPAPELLHAEPGLVNGYYRPENGEILLVEQRNPSGLNATLALAHELVHALQDRDGVLLRLREGERDRSVDRELALRAAVEGEATAYEQLLQGLHAKRVVSFGGRDGLEQRMLQTNVADATASKRASPLDAAIGDFAYAYGTYWARATLTRGQPLPIAALLSDSEFGTQRLLELRHGWAPRPPVPECRSRPIRVLEDQTLAMHDSLGNWLLQVYVRRLTGDPERARAVARAFRGDCLFVHRRDGRVPETLVWETFWSDALAARTFAELLHQLRAQQGATQSIDTTGLMTTLIVSPNGAGGHRKNPTPN
jgi:hypothetical protein